MDAALQFLADHWLEFALPLLGVVVGWLWGRGRAKREWAAKAFIRRLNVSLNLFERAPGDSGPTLRIRTLLEKDAADVFLNDVAVDHLVAAAGRTTKDDAILPLGDDSWFMLNAVLNELSERYSDGLIRRDLGVATTSAWYVIGLTYERDGTMKTQKLRAMVVQRDTLAAIADGMDEPKFERQNHNTRWRTLGQMARAWRKEPGRFLEVELVV